MSFKEKYSTKEEKDKIKITNEAYAVGEMLEELAIMAEKIRRILIK